MLAPVASSPIITPPPVPDPVVASVAEPVVAATGADVVSPAMAVVAASVPLAEGDPRPLVIRNSLPCFEDVVREVRALAADGTTEVTLLGQTVNSYHDGRHDFADLLRAVGAVDGIRRLRFTSPYPTEFTGPVIDAMATTAAVCEHVHLPVQSGSDAVLRRMLRRYTRAGYLQVVARLRSAVPGITFSTDIIVGFPGETDAQFEETLSLVTDADFDDAFTFKYSVRDGTPATRLRDHVPDAVASVRLERLIEVVRANARRKQVARVGQVHEVLVERPARRGGLMLGRTRSNQMVLLELPPSAVGEYHTCRLTGTTGSTFTGAVVTPALAVL